MNLLCRISPMTDLPNPLNLLLFMDTENAPVAELEAVAPGRLNVTAVPAQAFVDDAGMLPATTGLWKPRPWSTDLTPEQCEQTLRDTHVLVLTLPYPKRLLPRMPNLLWAQYLWAGISDLQHSDLWGGRVRLTSSRGYVDTTPIAEMVMAAALHFAKDLRVAVTQAIEGGMDASGYDLRMLAGRTMGVVGLGGIGLEVARLAGAMGMRVVASRLSITRAAARRGRRRDALPAARAARHARRVRLRRAHDRPHGRDAQHDRRRRRQPTPR